MSADETDRLLSGTNGNRLIGAIRQLDAGDWQPIETAPRDKTKVLLFVDGAIEIGWYAKLPRGADAWSSDISDEYGGYLLPTHWMPLPSPPTE